ncbi:RNA polymerase sigma factor [Maricaulaceae bacterium MS644]
MSRPVLTRVGGSPRFDGEDGRIAADRALAHGVGRGDRDAVATLTARCLPLVTGLAARTLRDPIEAEDVSQDTFLRVWRKIGQYQPERARLETWVARIALNLCYDRLRKRGEALMGDDTPELAEPRAGVEAALAAGADARRVRAVVAALPVRQRAALELCHFQDMGNIEAAAVLDISIEALESLLARGRRTLKTALSDEHADLLAGLGAGHGGET